MSDSGEFQEVESNYSGKLSYEQTNSGEFQVEPNLTVGDCLKFPVHMQ